jgi:hypothetical protein
MIIKSGISSNIVIFGRNEDNAINIVADIIVDDNISMRTHYVNAVEVVAQLVVLHHRICSIK